MPALRTTAEIEAAGAALAATWSPLTQEQVNYCFALLAPYLDTILATRQAAPAVHLTTEELAERLHTTPAAVRTMHSRGTGPESFRCGRRRLYPLAAVEEWEQELTRTGRPPKRSAGGHEKARG